MEITTVGKNQTLMMGITGDDCYYDVQEGANVTISVLGDNNFFNIGAGATVMLSTAGHNNHFNLKSQAVLNVGRVGDNVDLRLNCDACTVSISRFGNNPSLCGDETAINANPSLLALKRDNNPAPWPELPSQASETSTETPSSANRHRLFQGRETDQVTTTTRPAAKRSIKIEASTLSDCAISGSGLAMIVKKDSGSTVITSDNTGSEPINSEVSVGRAYNSVIAGSDLVIMTGPANKRSVKLVTLATQEETCCCSM